MSREPIAVIGLACRLPGAADHHAFWELLRRGGDAIRPVPHDRWDADALYDPTGARPGSIVTRRGGFLEDVASFDPDLYRLFRDELIHMDPQQRLLLEVAWEALEVAGLSADRLRGSDGSVLVGVSTQDYGRLLVRDLERIGPHDGLGGSLSLAANRISYLLDWQGPSVAVDTACSSSLIAVHWACRALRERTTSVALAGGVNLMLTPEVMIGYTQGRFLALDGRSKAFDASADGLGRGEGCGLVLLKRLSDAQRDGDLIWGVLRGSASNHNGTTNGITAPSRDGQAHLIRQALEDAGLRPGQISYLEAHGTGTALGDPIEVHALQDVFGPDRPAGQPLLVGTVKSNIGHLEAAAGVAGLLKVLLALRHREIPPTLHLRQINPHIQHQPEVVSFPTSLYRWEASEPRIAGVSSFGFGGANAHLIVEEAPATKAPPSCPVDRPLHLLVLRARTEAALRALVSRYTDFLRSQPAACWADVCASASTGRAEMSWRLTCRAADASAGLQVLQGWLEGRSSPAVKLAQAPRRQPRVAFLFSGQGSQYAGMGWQLFATQPVFRAALERCEAALRPLREHSLFDVMFPKEGVSSWLDRTLYTQPALFALEFALAELWHSWGVQPDLVLGHSVGEYAAACVAGVFSPEDGLHLIAERARLMDTLPFHGAMAAVFAEAGKVEAAIQPFSGSVAIAACNAPGQTVISGEAGSVEAILTQLSAEGVRAARLRVSQAFHSPLLEPMLEGLRQAAAAVAFQPARVPLVSNLSGAQAAPLELSCADYWVRHSRAPVQFLASIRAAHAAGIEAFLEIGPQATLTAIGQQCLPDAKVVWLRSLRQGQGDWEPILEALSALYQRGCSVDWERFERPYHRRRVTLPTYPFQRQRYWIERRPASRRAEEQAHPLLGSVLELAPTRQLVYRQRLSLSSHPWIGDHRVYDTALLPGAGYIAMAVAAAGTPVSLQDVQIQEPLLLPDQQAQRETELFLEPADSSGVRHAEVYSRAESAEDGWRRHCVLKLVPPNPSAPPVPVDLNTVRAGCRPLDLGELARRYAQASLVYGPMLQVVRSAWVSETTALVEIEAPEALADQLADEPIHPALLDGCVRLFPGWDSFTDEPGMFWAPWRVEAVRLERAAPRHFYAHVPRLVVVNPEQQTRSYDIELLDEQGLPFGRIEGFTLKRAPREAFLRSLQAPARELIYQVQWRKHSLQPVAPESVSGRWVVLGTHPAAAELAGQLERSGCHVHWGEVCHAAAVLQEALAATASGNGDGSASLVLRKSWEKRGDTSPERQRREGNNRPVAGAPGLCPHAFPNSCGEPVSLTGVALIGSRATAEALSAGADRARCLVEETMAVAQWLLAHGISLCRGLVLVTVHGVAVEPGDSVDPGQAALWGLGRSLQLEQPRLGVRLVELDCADSQRLSKLILADTESQMAFRSDTLLVPRLLRPGQAGRLVLPVGETVLTVKRRGSLDGLELTPLEATAPGVGEVQVSVRRAGLNFRDVLNVLGAYPGDPGPLGGEVAGVVTAVGEGVSSLAVGQRVFGLPTCGAFSTLCTTLPEMLVPLPPGLAFSAAATVPVAFCTAQAAFELAGLRAGERVLIHAATGGVGLAAVQLAQRIGAEIYATASTGKQGYLHSLGVQHVYDSRSTDFADQILRDSGNLGVAVVLNSLTSPGFIKASLRCLANGGRLVEISKRDIWSGERMRQERPDVNYQVLALDDWMLHDRQRVRAHAGRDCGTAGTRRAAALAQASLQSQRCPRGHALDAAGPTRRQDRRGSQPRADQQGGWLSGDGRPGGAGVADSSLAGRARGRLCSAAGATISWHGSATAAGPVGTVPRLHDRDRPGGCDRRRAGPGGGPPIWLALASTGRGDPCGGCAGRWGAERADTGSAALRLSAEGCWGLASAPGNAGAGAGLLRAVQLGGGDAGLGRSVSLCGRECVPGWSGPVSPGAGLARDQCGLGPLGG